MTFSSVSQIDKCWPMIYNNLVWPGHCQWACSHENESRSERCFGTWFGPFLIWKPDFSPCDRKAVSNQAFETRKKRAFWIVICLESLILGHVNAKLFRNVIRACAFKKMRAEAMHKRMVQSARADCAVGAKYDLAVRRSWSWLGKCLQCMWTHVVQITIPITFWIASFGTWF